MIEQELIKLAEVAGYEDARTGDELHKQRRGHWLSGEVYVLKKGDLSNLDSAEQLEYRYKMWYPDRNIEQAFEVLEGFDGIWGLCRENTIYDCELFPTNPIKTDKGNKFYSHSSSSLPEAICKAVLKANEAGK